MSKDIAHEIARETDREVSPETVRGHLRKLGIK